ncbi:MAG: hypothetical protein AB7T22_15375, partial [Calditrichaceae bacterium]
GPFFYKNAIPSGLEIQFSLPALHLTLNALLILTSYFLLLTFLLFPGKQKIPLLKTRLWRAG